MNPSAASAPLSPEGPVARLLGWVGFALLVVCAAIVPLFVIPPAIVVLDLYQSEMQYFKYFLLQMVAAGLAIVTALRLLVGGFSRLRPLRLDYALLAILAALGLLSVLMSPNSGFSLKKYLPELLMLGVAATVPLYVTTERRARVVLLGALFAGVVMALVPFLHLVGFTKIYAWILGGEIELILATEGTFMEGGEARAPYTSLTGNPEYTGGFIAAAFLLAGCFVMDGWGSRKLRRPLFWGVGLGALILIGLVTLGSQTRSGLVVIAAGIVARWLSILPLPGWWIASGLLATLFTFFVLGPWAAVALFMGLMIATLVWQVRLGLLRPLWSAIPLPTRLLLYAVPAGLLLGLVVAASVPEVRFRTVQLGERLVSGTSVQDRSVRERLIFYMLAWEMMSQRPLLGVGPGYYPANFHQTLARLSERDPSGVMRHNHVELRSWLAYDTHNDYFQIAAERGALGLLAFLALMTLLLMRLARIVRNDLTGRGGIAHALLVVLVGYLAMMLTSFPLQEASRLTTFYMLVGLALALPIIERGRDAGAVDLKHRATELSRNDKQSEE